MSNDLKEFYRAYKSWLDKGAPDYKPFGRSVGLCANLSLWCLGNESIDETELSHEMYRQFYIACKSTAYPFGENEYEIGRLHDSQHLNPARIKWVEEHCK